MLEASDFIVLKYRRSAVLFKRSHIFVVTVEYIHCFSLIILCSVMADLAGSPFSMSFISFHLNHCLLVVKTEKSCS